MRLKMKLKVMSPLRGVLLATFLGTWIAQGADAGPSEVGKRLQERYTGMLMELRAKISSALPTVDEGKKRALVEAREAVKKAVADATAAQQPLGAIHTAKALVDHAKGKWIGSAEKGIAQAEATLKKATTEDERKAALDDLAKWQKNKEEGLKALAERQAALVAAKADEAKHLQANQDAQAALDRARSNELDAAKALLAGLEPFLASDTLDAALVKAVVLNDATPQGLAEFAQQGPDQEVLVEKLLGDVALMREMLVAGGAKFGKYGRAMEIYTAIQKVSPKAGEGTLQRLALATSLEHAAPIPQSNPKDQVDAPPTVDPVKRYLHYEKAHLDGQLDPAFKDFDAWEYRLAVNSDAPDATLAWGREMLRTYRPDHIENPDYGWRYVSSVRTDVTYGSQNVNNDQPSLQQYQNIPMNGGVCGRRAFYGRFILRCFGIPTWGATQPAHAALSHWTPKGWVVNLGAGFESSWWDKDEAPRSGVDFRLETQARAHAQHYLRALRAQWVSRVLGEEAYNHRKGVDGGFWSSVGHYQAVVLASQAVGLGPLGQELGEANEPQQKQKVEHAPVTVADQKVSVSREGVIAIPSVAYGNAKGPVTVMKSVAGGMQVHCSGGFNAEYVVEAPNAGTYALTARVATLQMGQKFLFSANDAKEPVALAVPYTIGLWQQTQPVEIPLTKGRNILRVALQDGSRGVTIKEFTLTPAK